MGNGCYSAENSVALKDMKRNPILLSITFGLFLIVACNGLHTENKNNEPAADSVSEPEPQTALEWANHGTRLLNKGLPKNALESYDKALQLDSTMPYTYCSKASAYHKLGKPELALQNADMALQVDSEFTPAMANKARALRKLGRAAEADSVLNIAFKINPEMKKHFKE